MFRPSFVAFALLAAAPAALAEPRVGSRAIYNVTTTARDGRSISSTNVAELLQFDEASHRYLERDVHQTPGQPDQVQETWKGAAELLTDEKLDGILEDCYEAGGRQTLRWVPAGIFKTCALPVNADDLQPLSGEVWIGHVPFGMVHGEFTQKGVSTVIDLREFQEP